MASGRIPGPAGCHSELPKIDDGTSCLRESPLPVPIGVEQNFVFLITEALLHAVMPALSANLARTFVLPLHRYLNQYKINTLRRVSAFLGQVAVECAEFRLLTESPYYKSTDQLLEYFPKCFKNADAAKEYTKNPEKCANLIYAGKNGNGDVKSGDGWRYRGRGLMQLTGRENYAKFSKETGIDALNDPDLLTKPEYAVYSAVWYWDYRRLNGYADTKNYRILTERVNSACLHFSEREIYRKRAALALLRAIVKPGF